MSSYHERARRAESTLLSALISKTQAEAARVMDASESKLSRWKDENIAFAAKLIAACDLKIVPREHECHSPEYINALRELARLGLEKQARPVGED